MVLEHFSDVCAHYGVVRGVVELDGALSALFLLENEVSGASVDAQFEGRFQVVLPSRGVLGGVLEGRGLCFDLPCLVFGGLLLVGVVFEVVDGEFLDDAYFPAPKADVNFFVVFVQPTL